MPNPKFGPWPSHQINEFSASHPGNRVQPGIWQPIALADLPSHDSAIAAEGGYGPPVAGDFIYVTDLAAPFVSTGSAWVPAGGAASSATEAVFNRVQAVDHFNKVILGADSFDSGQGGYIGANTNFKLVGAHAATPGGALPTDLAALVGLSLFENGAYTLKTGTTSTDNTIVVPRANTDDAGGSVNRPYSLWDHVISEPENGPRIDVGLLIPTITTVKVWFGFRTSTALFDPSADTNNVFFYFDSTVSAFWRTAQAIGGTDTLANTAITVAANTLYHLAIDINPTTRIATYSINGVEVATSTAFTSGTTLGKFQVGVETATSAARSVRLLGAAISSTPN